MKQQFKNKKFTILIFSFTIVFLLLSFSALRQDITYIDLTEYENMLQNNEISKAQIKQNSIILYTKNGKFAIVKEAINLNQLLKQVPIQSQKSDDLTQSETLLMLFLLIIILLLFISKQRKKQAINEEEQKNKSFEIETLMPTPIHATTSNISFKDVAGIDNVKEELTEIVDFLKQPNKYKQYGINLPKGVLLIGPPGVGKTMVAKAIAGEANIPFFYQNGASFVQIYVGMGAKRVRELFSKAKAYAPSIIFIDEIDAVGKARGGSRNDERESTLNQLLTEMDGFEDNSGVTVIAATNRIEMIDEALLRSGRFDRRIFLSLPDLKDREEILQIYLKNKPHEVKVNEIARMSVGFSGAALSTLVNEAAINALRRRSKIIQLEDFVAVRDKVLLGKKKVLHFNDEEKHIQATYQSAKALCAFWFDIDFDKIGLLNSGLKDIDREIESKTQMICKIKVYLAGIAASNLAYKENFSNAKEDLDRARQIATIMVDFYGMGNTLIPTNQDVNDILQNSLLEVENFLNGMQEPLEEIKIQLLENENIDKETMQKILNKRF